MSDAVREVSDADFQSEVLDAGKPAMVDMWAPWCGPCRFVGPIIEELAGANGDTIRVCKLNVDENPETAQKYGITGIPSVLFFKDGAEVAEERMVGVRPKAEYQEAIDRLTS